MENNELSRYANFLRRTCTFFWRTYNAYNGLHWSTEMFGYQHSSNYFLLCHLHSAKKIYFLKLLIKQIIGVCFTHTHT